LGLLDAFYLLRAARPRDLVAHRLHRGERFPIPGAGLRVAAAGTADLACFLDGGRLGAEALRDAVRLAGRDLEGMARVLDFGCGCGRVLRHLAATPGPALYGADVHRRAVAWCGRSLPLAGAVGNRPEPPLDLPAGHFDLVYAFSVFTHLPPALAARWTDELRRLLAPGGLLVISTHGDAYREGLRPEELAAYDAGRVVVRAAAVTGSNACGVYHPPAAIRACFGRGLDLLAQIPEGARGNPRQDLAVLCRPGEGEDPLAREGGGAAPLQELSRPPGAAVPVRGTAP
jgi:SAM-dependent methyltransferase